MPQPQDEVPFKVTSGAATIVEFEYEGRRYRIRLGLTVLNVSAPGEIDPNTKMPRFNVNGAPVMMVEEVK